MPHFYNSVGIIFQRLQLFEPSDDTPRSTVANLGGTCPYITQIHVQHYPRNGSLKRNQWQFFSLFRFCFYTNNRRNWNLNVLLACDIDLHNTTDSSVMSQLQCLNLLVPTANTPLLAYVLLNTHNNVETIDLDSNKIWIWIPSQEKRSVQWQTFLFTLYQYKYRVQEIN